MRVAVVRGAGLGLIGLAVVLPWVAMRSGAFVSVVEEAGPLRPEMIVVPLGSFQMGSPEGEAGRGADEALHTVTLTRPFAIAATEVSQGMFRRVMGRNPSCAEYEGVPLLGDDLPVQCVTWFDAVGWCNRLSELEGLRLAYTVDGEDVAAVEGADGYRLPTEAEWEYAARAGSALAYGVTGEAREVCALANVADASAKVKFPEWSVFDCEDGVVGLAEVSAFPENPWGLRGVLGNVREWTWDWHSTTLGDATDPQGPSSGSSRVSRGGSWSSTPVGARLAVRWWGLPSFADGDLGFRPARSLPSALSPSDPVPVPIIPP